jgi:ubiquinone/menaquinone biosynthesis C-methylase UbiE
MTASATFDPVVFKATTRQQWQDAADAWHRWGSFIGSWLGEATETMIDLAHIAEGSRVLDVAAGAGEQSLRIASRVGPRGHVLVTDIAPQLLARAAQDAAAEGLSQVTTQEMDGEAVDTLPAGTFDAVVSRVGLIYFPDQQRALRGMHRVLRAGGRVRPCEMLVGAATRAGLPAW